VPPEVSSDRGRERRPKIERRLKKNQPATGSFASPERIPGGGTTPARPGAAPGGALSSWEGMEMEERGRSGRSQPPLLSGMSWAAGEAPVRRRVSARLPGYNKNARVASSWPTCMVKGRAAQLADRERGSEAGIGWVRGGMWCRREGRVVEDSNGAEMESWRGSVRERKRG
jgi:hypothetical protein